MSKDEVRTRIDIRCTVEEKAMIEAIARRKGLTISELVKLTFFGKKVRAKLK